MRTLAQVVFSLALTATPATAATGANGIGGNDSGRPGHVRHPAPIQAALNLLHWSYDTVPIIVVVEVCPPEVSMLAEGWITRNADGRALPTIYVAGWSELYRTVLANLGNRDASHEIIRLAGVLEHERAHIDQGADEEEAYAVQLLTIESLNAPLIDRNNVSRALETVRRQQHGHR